MRFSNNSTQNHIWELPYIVPHNLQWKNHNNITKRANSTLGFLWRNLKYCPVECKRLAYIHVALVHSTLEYGAIVWDPYEQQDIQSLEKIQHQAATFIRKHYYTWSAGCVKEMLEDLKLPPLQQRRLESRLVMLFKIVRGMVQAINADKVFTLIRNKRFIKSRNYQDCQTSSIVAKYTLNNSECYKNPPSYTD